MELPKNVIQMGKPDKLHKVFVEDYVISYVKQLNRILQGRTMGIALYGQKYVEDNVRYYFLYGAAEIQGLEGRGQYLSELEKESIEKARGDFFESYQFLAWCTLNGELPEGFFLMEQGKGMFVEGYACFFEKNECMLNFLVTSNGKKTVEKNSTEVQEKEKAEKKGYSAAWNSGRVTGKGDLEHRISERSRKMAELRSGSADRTTISKPARWRRAWVGVVIALCVIGIGVLGDEEKRRDLQVAARQVVESLTEQKLPDMESDSTWSQVQETEIESTPEPTPEPAPEFTPAPTPEPTPELTLEPAPELTPEPTVQTVTYVIKRGDTLLDLCRDRYGTDQVLEKICELNKIEDPDDIKIGQIIILPE